MQVEQGSVLEALKVVRDPDLQRDIVSLGFIKDLTIDGGRVAFTIELTTPACPVKDQMRDQARAAVMQVPGVSGVDVQMSARVREAVGSDGARQSVPGVKNVIAVGAGKGGVGKTTVAVNLAIALAKCGSKVGIIDADIYGPNVPIMLGMKTQLTTDGKKIVPAEKYGLQVISMGFLTGDDAPIIWRGPMLHGALQQFFREVRVDESRLPRHRSAAGHRRRGAQPQPDRAGRRRDRRDDAAAGVARRQPARDRDVQEAEHPAARHHREHELLRLHATASTRPTSSATAAASRWRPTSASRSSGAFRSTSRFAKAATPACR